MRFSISFLLAGCVAFASPSSAEDFEGVDLGILSERVVVPRPSEPQATYAIIQVTRGKWGNPISVNTRYSAATGWTYTKREYDCRAKRVRTLGSHDTYQQMLKSKGDPTWAPLVPGSSAEMVGSAVCRLSGA